MKIDRLVTGRAGLDATQTQLAGNMKQANTSITNAVAGAAAQGQEWARQYSEAEYAANYNAEQRAISEKINEYHENRRLNPIVREVGDTMSIADKKEQDWKDFYDKEIQGRINAIGDDRLRNNLSAAMAEEGERQRSLVKNAAIDENIQYMADQLNDNVNYYIENGNYDMASRLLADGENTGVIDAVGHRNGIQLINREQALDFARANGETYEDRLEIVRSQLNNPNNPDPDGLAVAEETLYKEEQARIKAARDGHLDQYHTEIIADKSLLFASDPYAEWERRMDEEKGENYFGADEKVKVLGWIAGQLQKLKGDDDGPSAAEMKSDAYRIALAADDWRDARGSLYDAFQRGEVDGNTLKWANDLMDSGEFKNLKDNAQLYMKNSLDDLEAAGFFGDPNEDRVGVNRYRKQIEDELFTRIAATWQTDRDQYTREGMTMETIDDLVRTELMIANTKRFNTQGGLAEPGNFADGQRPKETPEEAYLQDMMSDQFLFIVGSEGKQLLSEFANDPAYGGQSTVKAQADALGEKVAETIFGKEYGDLSKREKLKVDFTVNAGILFRKTEDLFEMAVAAPLGAEIQDSGFDEDGLPVFQTDQGTFRLSYNDVKKEEQFEKLEYNYNTKEWEYNLWGEPLQNTTTGTVKKILDDLAATGDEVRALNAELERTGALNIVGDSQKSYDSAAALAEHEQKMEDEMNAVDGRAPVTKLFERFTNWAFQRGNNGTTTQR